MRRLRRRRSERPRIEFRHVAPPRPEAAHEVELHEVDGAIVTAFEVDAPPQKAPRKTTRGAVYTSEGLLVPDSQRVGGADGDHVRAVDAERTEVVPHQVLAGTWLYVGNWMTHFGHFLTETLPTFWPDVDGVDGILAHPFIFSRREPSPSELALAAAAGSDDPPLIVDGAKRVERLLVPRRPFIPNTFAAPEAVAVWARVARRLGRATTRRVFLSRQRFHAAHREAKGRPHRRELLGETELDALVARLGFTVVYPEELDVVEQVRLAAGADLIAGVSGTALHLSAFAGSGTRVLELGDARAPNGLPNQQVISSAAGHRHGLLPYVAGPQATARIGAFDLRSVAAHLESLESRDPRPDPGLA
jgi:capsular polysaccharide biosynthesis protein